MATPNGGHSDDALVAASKEGEKKLARALKEFQNQLAEGTLTSEHVVALTQHRDPFMSRGAEGDHIRDQIAWWLAHYRSPLYGINPDFSNLRIPERKVGFDWLLVIPKGLTYRKSFQATQKIYPSFDGDISPEFLDTTLRDDRTTDDSYVVWIKKDKEADLPSQDRSGGFLGFPKKLKGITLLEREIAGNAYFVENFCHLDTRGITICTGSRLRTGSYPTTGFTFADGLQQRFMSPSSCGAYYCYREVCV